MAGYTEIAAHYRRLIHAGEMKSGDEMPSYNKAAEEHDVNRTTAIRAYDVLKSEGLIVSRSGKGTVVADSPVVLTGADRIDRLARTGQNYAPGEDSTGHRVTIRSCADQEICRALELDPTDEVVIRVRTFRQAGKPTTVGVSVIHPRALSDVPEIATEGPLPTLWHNLYEERTGRPIARGQRTARARQASPDELEALEIEAPDHVAVSVLVTNVTFHDDQGAIEHWEDVYAPGAKVPMKD